MQMMEAIRMALPGAVGLLIATAAYAQGGPVARVNGVAIPQSRLEFLVKAQVAQGQQDTPELRANIRNALIEREIIAQEALRKGLDKTPDARAQLELSRQQVLIDAYVRDYIRTHPVTDEVLQKEYDSIKSRLGEREYKARHILVASEAEAKDLIAQIRKGASFEKLASEKSRDPGSKARGGELDWNIPANYLKPFADALMNLKKGQMTDAPVQTQAGWHIIRLDDERAFKAPTLEQIKPRLQQNTQQQFIQKAIAELRAKAKVE
ncbi:MAG: peptidylprolyl isomerase [Betaproteobacteria bacterium]|nr:peptidylprolyl isomerase [Betaproteobacteria bacterium]